jgi:pimeloyl-ACP methyl ester carboxylesterase
MARRLGARHEVIPAAVHSPAIENPRHTLAVLLDFWASVRTPGDGPATA